MSVKAVALVAVDRHLHGFTADRDAALAVMAPKDRIDLARQLMDLAELLDRMCGDCGEAVQADEGYTSMGADRVSVTYHSICGPSPGPWDDAWYEAHPEGEG